MRNLLQKVIFTAATAATLLMAASFVGSRIAATAAQFVTSPRPRIPPLQPPLFDGKADSDSYNVTGTEGGTCTPTNVSFVEDPPSSGNFAMEFDGASGILACGDILDGLHSGPMSVLVWIDPDTSGEAGFGHILAKQTDASNRSWQLIIDSGVSDCTGGGTDCFNLTNYNTGNVNRNHDSAPGSANYGAGYISVLYVLTCSSTTLESCDTTQAYINGVASAMNHGSVTGTIRTADSSDGFYIGNRPADDRTTDGKIKRVAVWNVALTAAHAATVHAQGPDYQTP